MSSTLIEQSHLDPLWSRVDKAARYIGGELNSVLKTEGVELRCALAFPDVYEVAESHIGLKILYEIINSVPHYAAERAYALWPDYEAGLKELKLPLHSLETRRPLSDFDLIGFTLQYELSYPTILAMLEHGGIPLRSADRKEDDTIVLGGGSGAYNPEPIADFFDAFLLGDGEEAILEILDVIRDGRKEKLSRKEILNRLSYVEGIYIPSHFEVKYQGPKIESVNYCADVSADAQHKAQHGGPRVTRRIVADLNDVPYVQKPIVPNVTPVHERVAVEIQRGCSQACRFCQAGMINRPTRQRSPEKILELADFGLNACGADEVGLLSLSAGDYEPISEVLTEFFARYNDRQIAVSLPSMRTETMTAELAHQIATVKKSTFTLAPEAGTERLRRVINKTNTEENLLEAVRSTVAAGWKGLKFYFMIGLPTETDEDILAIVDLAKKAKKEANRLSPNVRITISASTFVPKPNTTFQWEEQIDERETRRRHQMLRERLREVKIGFRYHSPEQSYLEGVLARGDRRLGPAIEKIMKAGARLDAWSEHYDHARWMTHLGEELTVHNLEPQDYLRRRDDDEILPWDHLDAGILKKHLLTDKKRSHKEDTITDCALSEKCFACGGCDLFNPYNQNIQDSEGALKPVLYHKGELLGERPESRLPFVASKAVDRHLLRFRYAKRGSVIHFSHLEIMEQIIRAVRQSGLPVIYSEGHVPRPRIAFSPACPTGMISEAEFFDIDCEGQPDPAESIRKLERYLPRGAELLEATLLPYGTPAINEVLQANEYEVNLGQAAQDSTWASAIEEYEQKEIVPVRILRKRKVKVLDLRAFVENLELVDDGIISLTIKVARSGGVKTSEVLAAIFGIENATPKRITKTKVQLGSEIVSKEEFGYLKGGTAGIDLTGLFSRASERQAADASKPRGTVPYAE